MRTLVEQYSKSVDAEGNTVGDTRPQDYQQYWNSLDETQRAFERLAGTDAALYIDYYERVLKSIPKPHIAP